MRNLRTCVNTPVLIAPCSMAPPSPSPSSRCQLAPSLFCQPAHLPLRGLTAESDGPVQPAPLHPAGREHRAEPAGAPQQGAHPRQPRQPREPAPRQGGRVRGQPAGQWVGVFAQRPEQLCLGHDQHGKPSVTVKPWTPVIWRLGWPQP
jgi:hypothetical protein